MFFGLTNAPAAFQARINNVLRKFLGIFIVVYLDDIIIFSQTEEEHANHVDIVLKELLDNNLRIKPRKCEWAVQQTEFLGHIVSLGKIVMSPRLLNAILEWPVP